MSAANASYQGVIIFTNLFELKTPEIFLVISWPLRNFRRDPIINSNVETFLFKLTLRSVIAQVMPPVQPGHTKQMVISVAILASWHLVCIKRFRCTFPDPHNLDVGYSRS